MTLNPADDAFKSHLLAELPEEVFRSPEARYFEEPRGRWSGQAGILALPRNVQEVSTLVRLAGDHRVGIVPYAGGTGLVGGQVMQEGPLPLLISVERMNAVRAVYPEENVLIAEAGVILADVQKSAEDVNRLFPLSLAAQGSARIGGNLSTNAGGTGVLRYGNARDLCLGLEVVLPDGQIWNGLSRLRKDNTGYDLRNLLIGAEGTLGIITAASLKLWPRPGATGTAMLVVPSPAAALKLLSMARDTLGDGVSAFELIHRQGLEFLASEIPEVRRPLDPAPEWSVLIEIGITTTQSPEEALEGLFGKAMEAGLVSDGVIAQSKAQQDEFWSVREHLPEANRRVGSVSSQDLSLPLGAVPEFIDRAGPVIAKIGAFRTNCFGHVGDGNLHFNIFPMPGGSRMDHIEDRKLVKRALHDLVHEFGGSVSAEHGIGRLKVDDLERYADPVKLATMRSIKSALDPKGIMNPGAVLRA